ncbi:unnamed protein product, partial [marine sediment metagenome]
ARDDNPLFVPESHPGGANAWNMFRAIADYNAIGYPFWGIEHIVAEDGTVRPEAQTMVDSVRCVAVAIPLLLKYQGTGKIHAIIQEEFTEFQWLDLDGYLGFVQFGEEPPVSRVRKDWRHTSRQVMAKRFLTDYLPQTDSSNRGRGLVIQACRHELYLVGANYLLFLCSKLSPDKNFNSIVNRLDHQFRMDEGYQLRVDEGHFDQNDEFVV